MKDFGRLQPHMDAMAKAVQQGYHEGYGTHKCHATPPLPNATVVDGQVQGLDKIGVFGFRDYAQDYARRGLLFHGELKQLEKNIASMPHLKGPK